MPAAFLANLCLPTLASGDSDGMGKLIFFGIILVVWAGAAIANSIKQAAAKRRANMAPPSMNWQQPTAPAWPNVSPPPVPVAGRRRQPRRVIPPPPVPRRSFAPPPPPPLPFSTAVIAPSQPSPDAPEPAPPSVRSSGAAAMSARSGSARPSSIGAADIRRWLTPEVLRGQYFVTEVFDPPPGALD
jgi:hypothetical protein